MMLGFQIRHNERSGDFVAIGMTSTSQAGVTQIMSPSYGLESFFRPQTLAVVGATDKPGSVGRTVLSNLLHGTFAGRIYAVNPNRQELCGLKAYPKIGAMPEAVDLAVVVTPARTVPAVITDCVRASVKACVVISAGFRERGPDGVELEN